MKPLNSASPHAIIMIGIPGSGKSTFAERFAETFQAPIVSQTKLQREFALSTEASAALSDSILSEYMKTHRTVLIDGGVDSKDVRDPLVRRLTKAGYQILVVWVQTDTAEAFRRATKPYPRGSGLEADEFDRLVELFDAPHRKEKMVVISGKHTYTSQLKIVLKKLANADTKQPPSPPRQTPDGRSHTRQVFIR